MNIIKYTIEHQHLASIFDCGNIILNNFLKSTNALDENQGITYIMVSDNKDFIIGYYNISVGRVDLIEQTETTVVYKPMGGSININYLAIHSKYQHTHIGNLPSGQKIYLGDYLLRSCEKTILALRKHVGIAFITLYSTQEGYNLYHNRNSYEIFETDMNTFIEERDLECYKLYKCIDDLL